MKESLLKKKKKGFTLIELIVVIAIIAIIALIAIPKVMGYQDDAKKKADIANGKSIANAVAILVTENNADIIAKKGQGGFDASTVSAIKDKLQSFPTPQAKISGNATPPSNFYVYIDKDGNVSVYSGVSNEVTGNNAKAATNMVYPTPGSDFK